MNEKVIKTVMLVSGALTCTMFYAAIAPEAALRSNFGETLAGPVGEIVVRNWGALITLVGVMLIYGAYHPPVRSLVLLAAASSKLVFIGLLLTYGRHYLGQGVGVAAVVDTITVVLFVTHLVIAPRRKAVAV